MENSIQEISIPKFNISKEQNLNLDFNKKIRIALQGLKGSEEQKNIFDKLFDKYYKAGDYLIYKEDIKNNNAKINKEFFELGFDDGDEVYKPTEKVKFVIKQNLRNAFDYSMKNQKSSDEAEELLFDNLSRELPNFKLLADTHGVFLPGFGYDTRLVLNSSKIFSYDPELWSASIKSVDNIYKNNYSTPKYYLDQDLRRSFYMVLEFVVLLIDNNDNIDNIFEEIIMNLLNKDFDDIYGLNLSCIDTKISRPIKDYIVGGTHIEFEKLLPLSTLKLIYNCIIKELGGDYQAKFEKMLNYNIDKFDGTAKNDIELIMNEVI